MGAGPARFCDPDADTFWEGKMYSRSFLSSSLIASTAVFLFGCAEPASVSGMVPTGLTPVPASHSLSKRVGSVTGTGGEETNPLWMSQISSADFNGAVEQSLRSAGMFSPGSDLTLQTFVLSLDQPMFGMDLTVELNVRYKLVDRQGRVRFDKTLKSSYTAKMLDSFLAVERLKLANEGAARANIALLIQNLKTSGLGSPVSAVS